ncbi:MAG: hypothetical protein EU541_07760 [Promethearchaeota archaeon]|nr:MAG: hypothetical protein EU541_07760 [Candidatus Lokiarchaeota archaeon]
MDKRFEAMDKRFEELQKFSNQRFEAIDRRFEAIDKRFEELQKTMERRFEKVDERFETLIRQMNKGFEEARKDRQSLRTFISTVSSRSGPDLENLILEILDDKLIQASIQKANISKIKLIDTDGDIYYENYSTDIDVVLQDGKTLLIEVKSSADNRDIDDLLRKGKLYKIQYNKAYDELILVCLEINRINFEQAIQQNVNVIAGKIT